MQKKSPSTDELAQLFAEPPLEYSDFMTYFWESGKLSKKQLTWQLEQIKAKGVGGTWYYPRYVRGEPHVVTLARSAWAGSQRWGTTVWSGDTSSDWASLRNQISEGQAAGLSGLSYWPVRNLQQCIAQLWHLLIPACSKIL